MLQFQIYIIIQTQYKNSYTNTMEWRCARLVSESLGAQIWAYVLGFVKMLGSDGFMRKKVIFGFEESWWCFSHVGRLYFCPRVMCKAHDQVGPWTYVAFFLLSHNPLCCNCCIIVCKKTFLNLGSNKRQSN